MAGSHGKVLGVDLNDHLLGGQSLHSALGAAENHVHQPLGLHRQLIGGGQIDHLHTAGGQVHGLGLQPGAVKADRDGGDIVQQIDICRQLDGHLVHLVQTECGKVDGADGQSGQCIDLFCRACHLELLAAEGIAQHRVIEPARRVDKIHLHRQGRRLVHLQRHVHIAFFQRGVLELDLFAAAGVEAQRGVQRDRLGQLAVIGCLGGAGSHLAQFAARTGQGDGLLGDLGTVKDIAIRNAQIVGGSGNRQGLFLHHVKHHVHRVVAAFHGHGHTIEQTVCAAY